jgi:hypothetical protein
VPFDVGFDFRSTQLFVTDPSSSTYEISDVADYPVTRTVNGSSVTFGWETLSPSGSSRNRGSSVDARIAGIQQVINDGTATGTFRVDLPATGDYTVGLAMGDGVGGNAQTEYLVVKDTSSALITFSGVAIGSSQFLDAAGNLWSPAAWPGSNVSVQKTFTTTILRVTIGGTASTNSSTIAHLRVTAVSSGFTAKFRKTLSQVGTGVGKRQSQ